MKNRLAIVANSGHVLKVADWIALVEKHPSLVVVTGRTARDPATLEIVKLRDRPDLVDVILDQSKIGRMQWEQEYYPAITFDAVEGHETDMIEMLEELAEAMNAVVGEYPDDRA